MTKFGQVTAYEPESGMATIVYARPEACEKCGACGARSHTGSITLKADCAVGNWVRVELPDGRFLTAAAMAYVGPLCGFLGGLALGYALSGGDELWALLGSLAGLSACALALRLADGRIKARPEWQPRVTAVYGAKPDMADIGCAGEKP